MIKNYTKQLKQFFRLEHIHLFIWTMIIVPVVSLAYFYIKEIIDGTVSNNSFAIGTAFSYLGLQWSATVMSIPFLIPVFLLFCIVDHLLRSLSINVYWRYLMLWVTYVLIRLLYTELLGSNRLWHYDRFWGAYMGLIQLFSFTMVMLFVLSRVMKGKYDLDKKRRSDDQALTT
jgi:hypothetical protein